MNDAGFEQYVINRLNEYIKASGLTSYQFAVKTGLSPCTVYNILNGRSKPSLYVIGIVMNYLRIEPIDFFSNFGGHKDYITASDSNRDVLDQIFSQIHDIRDILISQH